MKTLDLTDAEAPAPVRKHSLDEDRFPRAPRLDPLKAILVKLALAAAARYGTGPRARTPAMTAYHGPPMTLGNAAAVKVRSLEVAEEDWALHLAR
jgi:hypothetical protein